MGDRTSVTLYFLASQKEKVDAILEPLNEEPESEDTGDSQDLQPLCIYEYSEVNYGELGFLQLLAAAGIAYESAWGSGSEYDEGSQYCRFTKEGECRITTVYDSDLSIPIEVMLTLLHQPDALVQFIKGRHARNTVLPWTNQAEYGATYQAMQLITAKPIN